MDARELRIGNYIKKRRFFAKPEYKETICDIYDIKAQINNGEKVLLPIPLTEEWLVKLGFEKSGYVPVWMSKRLINNEIDRIDILINEKKQMYFVPSVLVKWSVELKYVHQLQNLYFALTGEELTIKE